LIPTSEAMFAMKKSKLQRYPTLTRPKYEKLPWPGLKDKNHLVRLATRVEKGRRKIRANEMWAQKQIARVLEYVSEETAMCLVFREARIQGRAIPRPPKALLCFLEMMKCEDGIIKFDGKTYRLQKKSPWTELEKAIRLPED
jgi:hypothetical protein